MYSHFRHSATGAAAINETVAFSSTFEARLVALRIHLSAAGGAGDLTVTLDSHLGAAYDVVLFRQDMTSVVDLNWMPECCPIHKDDSVVIAWANGSTVTYGLEAIWALQEG